MLVFPKVCYKQTNPKNTLRLFMKIDMFQEKVLTLFLLLLLLLITRIVFLLIF